MKRRRPAGRISCAAADEPEELFYVPENEMLMTTMERVRKTLEESYGIFSDMRGTVLIFTFALRITRGYSELEARFLRMAAVIGGMSGEGYHKLMKKYGRDARCRVFFDVYRRPVSEAMVGRALDLELAVARKLKQREEIEDSFYNCLYEHVQAARYETAGAGRTPSDQEQKREKPAEEEEPESFTDPLTCESFIKGRLFGQDHIAAALGVDIALLNSAKSRDEVFSNINHLIIGPPGSGKNTLVSALRQMVGDRFLFINAASLSLAGYAGRGTDDIRAFLEQKADKRGACFSLVCFDEYDKRSMPSYTAYAENFSEQVQNEINSLADGSFNSTIFLYLGTFTGIFPDASEEREREIGFYKQAVALPEEKEEPYSVSKKDLIKYGVTPEMASRMDVLMFNRIGEDTYREMIVSTENGCMAEAEKMARCLGLDFSYQETYVEALLEYIRAEQEADPRTLLQKVRTDLRKEIITAKKNGKTAVLLR